MAIALPKINKKKAITSMIESLSILPKIYKNINEKIYISIIEMNVAIRILFVKRYKGRVNKLQPKENPLNVIKPSYQ